MKPMIEASGCVSLALCCVHFNAMSINVLSGLYLISGNIKAAFPVGQVLKLLKQIKMQEKGEMEAPPIRMWNVDNNIPQDDLDEMIRQNMDGAETGGAKNDPEPVASGVKLLLHRCWYTFVALAQHTPPPPTLPPPHPLFQPPKCGCSNPFV